MDNFQYLASSPDLRGGRHTVALVWKVFTLEAVVTYTTYIYTILYCSQNFIFCIFKGFSWNMNFKWDYLPQHVLSERQNAPISPIK